jgi:hypothetical protein
MELRPAIDIRRSPQGNFSKRLTVEVCQPEIGGPLPHRCGESDVGSATHSSRTEAAWFRCFGANGTAMDEESADEASTGKAMGDLPVPAA